ncbi:rhodanese-like domain-containing protein [Psychromonas sp.]|uniref:rhodanese-like domain-containing protein n=1 Tax=Psychromonas sp. TaxID=1884585 RepID=UPI0035627F05
MDQITFYKAKLEYETDSWDLSEAIANGDDVIDARSPEAYELEHISGAINIPHRSMNVDSTAHLDKPKTYVSYCDGIGCNASTKAALKLTKLGFTVKELLGGLDWWLRDGYETHGQNGKAGKQIICGC